MSKIQETLQSILGCFESGNIPEAIAYSMFPIADLPSANWSLLNRTLMFLSGTADARGFRQWQAVDRRIKKGAKAIYILIPRLVKTEDEEKPILSGFMTKPVFRMEDTDGAPLSYQAIELPALPLLERAQQWDIKVTAIGGNYQYYGYFAAGRNEIALATEEETVFFHELSHAAHHRIYGSLDKIPTWKKEVVAELSSAVLCRMVGKTSKYLGNQYRYISHYAEKAGLTPVNACLKVISDVDKVLRKILDKPGGTGAGGERV